MRNLTSTIGWGVFCASSWTWCIGMFLPILMIERFGWWGFFTFALPNIVGCAGFGYVVGNRVRSGRFVTRHRTAMRAFSVVTLGYHVFFIAFLFWLLLPLGEGRFWTAVLAPAAFISIGVVLSNLPDRAWPVFGGLVYVVSLTVFAVIGLGELTDVPWRGRLSHIDLWWLAPTLAFGFLLCPYLDLTFHRALRNSPSPHTFSVFGITFLIMIVMTCAYWDVLSVGLPWAIAVHLLAQSCFTIAAHTRELRASTGEDATPLGHRRWDFPVLVTLPLLALPLAFVGEFVGDPLVTSLDMYVRFLVFYGLAFPAYVFVFMIGRAAHSPPQPRSIALFPAFVLIASTFYEAGFVREQFMLLPIPLAALLIWWGYHHFHSAATSATESGIN